MIYYIAKHCHVTLEAAKRAVAHFHRKLAVHRQWLVKCGRPTR